MDCEFVHVDINGTLADPAVAFASGVVVILLSGITWLVVGWLYKVLPNSPLLWRRRCGIGILLLAVAYLGGSLGQFFLATHLYRMIHALGPCETVGFWPTFPFLPVWGLAVGAGLVNGYRQKVRLRQIAESIQ